MNDTEYQSQQQQAANQTTMLQEGIDTALKDVHTFLPGIIHSFNPDTQTAEVQPAIKRIFTEKGAVNLPLCVDVPVAFLKAGGFCITMPVNEGDECLLGFFERAIDRWFANGGTQEPSEYRLHDLSDGFAIVGISSLAQLITGFNPTDLEVRLLSGASKVQLKPDGTIKQVTTGGSTELTPGGDFIIDANVIMKRGLSSTNPLAVNSFAADISAKGKSVYGHIHKEHDNFDTSPPV